MSGWESIDRESVIGAFDWSDTDELPVTASPHTDRPDTAKPRVVCRHGCCQPEGDTADHLRSACWPPSPTPRRTDP